MCRQLQPDVGQIQGVLIGKRQRRRHHLVALAQVPRVQLPEADLPSDHPRLCGIARGLGEEDGPQVPQELGGTVELPAFEVRLRLPADEPLHVLGQILMPDDDGCLDDGRSCPQTRFGWARPGVDERCATRDN